MIFDKLFMHLDERFHDLKLKRFNDLKLKRFNDLKLKRFNDLKLKRFNDLKLNPNLDKIWTKRWNKVSIPSL